MNPIEQPEAVGRQRSLARTIVSYSSATMIGRCLLIVQGLVVIRLMGPEMLGVWLGLQLIPIYCTRAHLGLVNAVNRQVPFYRGRSDHASARSVENVVRGDLALLSVGFLCLVLVLTAAGVWKTDVGRGVLTLLFVTGLQIVVQFYQGLFRARQEFGRASLSIIVSPVVSLCGLPLVYYWGFNGLLARSVAVNVVTLLCCVAIDGFARRMEFNWEKTRELIRIGLPIMIVGYGVVVFASMDRTLILLFLDARAMGEYALCFAVAKIMALIPAMIGQIFYPRMTEKYAVEGISRSLVRLAVQASLVSATISGIIFCLARLTLPWVVATLYPAYAAGLPALRIALVGYFLVSLSAGPNYFLISTVQKRRQLVVLLAATAVMFLSGYFLADRGLVGIAWSLVIAVSGYIAGIWLIVLVSVSASGRRA